MSNEIRQRNRARVLQLLMDESPISRVEIAEKVGLSKSTISVIVSNLLDEGLVFESGSGSAGTQGGRRPILLQFKNAARVACGIEIDAEMCRGVLVDLRCEPLHRSTLPVSGHEVTDVVDTVASTIKELLRNRRRKTWLGCGIAVVGLVNSDLGIIRFSTHFVWRDVPLRDLLAERLDCPVYVLDRPKAAVLGERWYGVGQGVDDLVYIHVGTGIGAGIVIKGELLAGVSHTAGEIGHITLQRDGPLCKCGNRGCLEMIASGPAIARHTIALIKAGNPTILTDWAGDNLESITAKMVDQAASQGDELALSVIHETGEYVGIAIADLLNLINPQMVIVGGPVARFGQVFLDSIRETVHQRALSLPASTAQIVLSKLKEDAEAIGAAALVLQESTKPARLAHL